MLHASVGCHSALAGTHVTSNIARRMVLMAIKRKSFAAASRLAASAETLTILFQGGASAFGMIDQGHDVNDSCMKNHS